MSLLEDFMIRHYPDETCRQVRVSLSEEGLWLGEQLVGRMDEAIQKPLSDAYRLIDYYVDSGKIRISEVSHLRLIADKVHEVSTQG